MLLIPTGVTIFTRRKSKGRSQGVSVLAVSRVAVMCRSTVLAVLACLQVAEAKHVPYVRGQYNLTKTRSGPEGWETGVECLRHHFHSQFGEDQALLPLLLALTNHRPGRFVELGAYNGIKGSNTLVLEACYGWTGLLIEANPRNFESVKNSGRNGTIKRHSAVCKQGTGPLRMTVGCDQMAHIVSPKVRPPPSKKDPNNTRCGEPVNVPCEPLESLMESSGLEEGADFLSLDVEGAEHLVLEVHGVPTLAWRPFLRRIPRTFDAILVRCTS